MICGIQNIGNTCYMNSALQVIVHNPVLNKIFQLEFDTPLLKVMSKFYSSYNEGSPDPKPVYTYMAKKYDIFYGFSQNDSNEFLFYILDEIDEDMRKIEKIGKNNDESLISQFFDIGVINRVRCLKCDNNSKNKGKERFLFLNMDITDDLTLDNMYKKFRTKEILNDPDNLWFCDKCKRKQESVKSVGIDRFPSYLFIFIKRFDSSDGIRKKNNKQVQVPTVWREGYNLVGMIIHMGSLNSGHYISLYKVKKQWILFNDSSTTKLNESQIGNYTKDAFILCYEQ
jgi:ubiquitin C-terminal hydrolase